MESKLKSFGKSRARYNLDNSVNLRRRVIDPHKVDRLSMVLPYDFVINGAALGITDNVDLGAGFMQYLSDVCSTAEYLVYDEPERLMDSCWAGDVYTVLGALGGTFEECWITSHYEGAVAIDDARFYVVKNKKDLYQVSREDAVEILSKI